MAAVSVAAVALLGGCGSSSTVAPLARADAIALHRDVAAVRSDDAAGQPTAAHAAIAALRSRIEVMLKTGRISTSDGRLLSLEAGRADRRIAVRRRRVAPAPSPPQPQSSSTASNATPPPATDHGPGHGKGHGNGGGEGGD